MRQLIAPTRQERLVELDGGGVELDQADVGGHLVAGGELDHVARHQLHGRQLGPLLVAQTERVLGLQRLERLDGLLGVAVLVDAHAGVQHQNGQNNTRLDPRRQVTVLRLP